MAGYTRVGPGQYRGPDGKIVNSLTDPNKSGGIIKQRPVKSTPGQMPHNIATTGPVTDATITNAGQTVGQDALAKALEIINSGGLGNPITVSPEESQKIYDAAYGKLTRNFDYNKAKDQKALEDQLYQRGIAYSSDPNSQYQQQLHDLNTNYNTQLENAGQTAQLLQGQGEDRLYNQKLGNSQNQQAIITSLTNLGVPWEQLSNQQKATLMQATLAKLQRKTALDVANINNRQSGGGGSQDSAFIL